MDGFELFILLGDMDIRWESFQRLASEKVEVFFLDWTGHFNKMAGILPKIEQVKFKQWMYKDRSKSTQLWPRNACWELFCFLFSRKSSSVCSAQSLSVFRFSMCLPVFGNHRFMMIIREKKVASLLLISMIVFSMGTDKCNDFLW